MSLKAIAGGVRSIIAGSNITVDSTNPQHPIISATGGGGGVSSINGETGDIQLTSSGGTIQITTPDASTVNFETTGGGGTPGGSDTDVQINNNGTFYGDAGLVYDYNSSNLRIGGGGTAYDRLIVDGGVQSTSNLTAIQDSVAAFDFISGYEAMRFIAVADGTKYPTCTWEMHWNAAEDQPQMIVLAIQNNSEGFPSLCVNTLSPTALLSINDRGLGTSLATFDIFDNDGSEYAMQVFSSGFRQISFGGDNTPGISTPHILLDYDSPFIELFDITTGNLNTHFTGDSTNNSFINKLGGNFGVGTGVPQTIFHAVERASSAGSLPRGILIEQNDTSANSPLYMSQKSRGTNAAPTAVINGDGLWNLLARGYDGGGYIHTCQIIAVVSGSVSSGNIPTDLVFYTGNSSGGSERFRITSSGSNIITSTATTAFSVGRNGSTNPAFNVNANTAASVTGITVTSNSANNGATITATSTASSEALTASSKGTAALTLGNGNGNLIKCMSSQLIFTPNTADTTASNVRFSFIGRADNTLTASTEAPDVYFNLGQIRQHATGALTLQRDFRITGSTHSAVAASTITDSAVFSIDGIGQAGTNVTITNAHGILIQAIAVSGTVTNAYAATYNAPTGATNNYPAQFLGGRTNFAAAATGYASLNIPAGTAPTSPVTGDVWNDSTQNMLAFSNGNTLYQAGNLYTATADKTINSTSPTTCFSSTKIGTTTIKANTLKVGQKFSVWGAGYYSTPLANTSTVTITVKIGSTTISTVTTAAFPASATNLPFDFVLNFTVRSIGASATIVCDGGFNYSTALSAIAKTSNSLSSIGTITFDSTIDEAMDVLASWSAVTTQTATVQQAKIDFL